jgi:hypothetical protein
MLIDVLISWQSEFIRHLEKETAGQTQFGQSIACKFENVVENLALRRKGDVITIDREVHIYWILLKNGIKKFEKEALYSLLIKTKNMPQF